MSKHLSGLFERLDNVQVDNKQRIDAADQLFCEEQERLYRETVELFSSMKNKMKAIFDQFENRTIARKNGYIEQYRDIDHVITRLKEIKESHVQKICRYFKTRYNVSLDEDTIFNKYRDQEITYETVVDEIFVQLGGFNFGEMATKEIKDAMVDWATNSGGSKAKVKGSRITLENMHIISFDSIWHRYELDQDNARKLFKAITHFDSGVTEAHESLTSYYIPQDSDRYGAFLTEKLELELTKVKAIKFFKNSRIDIDFTSGEAALQFAKEYCGYIAAVAQSA